MSGRKIVFVLCALTTLVSAQTFSAAYPGTFVDISTTGTAIAGAADDSEHNIVTTIGNSLFPAGNVRIGNNGAAVAGVTTGEIGFANVTVAATGVPTGLPATAASHLLPLWDDYVPPTATAATTLYWQEIGNVLYIQWNNEDHYNSNGAPAPPGTVNQGLTVTFQIQVFANPAPCTPAIQYLYSDTVFGGAAAPFDNGASATIGYVKGTLAGVSNTLYSFDTPTISSGAVLSILPTTFTLTASSPFGPGWLQLDFAGGPCGGGTYVLAVTLNAGLYPNGWLYGIDIPYAELVNEFNTGAPFVGPLNGVGAATIGPIPGVPPITFYAVGLNLGAGGVPNLHTPAITYTVP